jgi:hypothetical protein
MSRGVGMSALLPATTEAERCEERSPPVNISDPSPPRAQGSLDVHPSGCTLTVQMAFWLASRKRG